MTNERAWKALAATAKNLRERRHESDEEFERILVVELLVLASEAYEEAARVVCIFCAAGQPLVRPFVASEVAWAHPLGGHGQAGCAAHRIHVLKEQLVSELAVASR